MTTLKFFAWFVLTTLVRASDIQFLQAIAEVETGNNPDVIGSHGEVSAFQITPVNWHRYTKASMRYARNRFVATYVAEQHLKWIKRQLRIARDDCRDNPEELNNTYILALAWHCGPHGTRGVTEEKIDYATRVMNVYHDIVYHEGDTVQ